MPLVTISLFEGRTIEDKLSLQEAVHAAIVDTYGVPVRDYNQRILEFRQGEWMVPPEASDRYVLIEILQFEGRSPAVKERLYRELVTQLEFLGTPPEEILIVIREEPLHNWGIRGGQRADRVDLGFVVKKKK